MIHETLQWALEAMGGESPTPPGDTRFSGVSTDTREMAPGNLFFCLVATRDGHAFATQARAQGAAGIVIDRKHRDLLSSEALKGPTLVVKDTQYALGELAHHWRRRFSIPIVALTGSNGKTTTKELIKAVLSTRYRVLATEGNFNNLIGVPKTLFRLNPEVEIAVVEMGMNDFGEIKRLTQITEPTVGLITNVATAHLEKLKDLQGVALAKGELFAGLKKSDMAIVNQKDPIVTKLPTPAQRVEVGHPDSGLWGEILEQNPDADYPLFLRIHQDGQNMELKMKLPGPHNLDNVLLALAVGRHFSVPLAEAKKALEEFQAAPSRMQGIHLREERFLLDDCYNANPASTRAALRTLQGLKRSGKSMAVLGDMNELGQYRIPGHREVGEAAARSGVDFLFTVGESGKETLAAAAKAGMKPEQMQHFKDVEAAQALLDHWPEDVRWILVKGSRTIHLERLVSSMKERL